MRNCRYKLDHYARLMSAVRSVEAELCKRLCRKEYHPSIAFAVTCRFSIGWSKCKAFFVAMKIFRSRHFSLDALKKTITMDIISRFIMGWRQKLCKREKIGICARSEWSSSHHKSCVFFVDSFQKKGNFGLWWWQIYT